jgi:hypothetical protein
MPLPRPPQRITVGFAFSYVDRAIQEGLANRRFGQPEMAAVIEYFGADPPQCAYCGDEHVSRWDHLVAVKCDGDTVLGNMVPACSRCDDSKRDVPYEEWMLSGARHSPKSRGVPDVEQRVTRLRAYAEKFDYSPRNPAERLVAADVEELMRLRQRLGGVRKEIEQFLARQGKRRQKA